MRTMTVHDLNYHLTQAVEELRMCQSRPDPEYDQYPEHVFSFFKRAEMQLHRARWRAKEHLATLTENDGDMVDHWLNHVLLAAVRRFSYWLFYTNTPLYGAHSFYGEEKIAIELEAMAFVGAEIKALGFQLDS